jgi:hypothetical protein
LPEGVHPTANATRAHFFAALKPKVIHNLLMQCLHASAIAAVRTDAIDAVPEQLNA